MFKILSQCSHSQTSEPNDTWLMVVFIIKETKIEKWISLALHVWLGAQEKLIENYIFPRRRWWRGSSFVLAEIWITYVVG